MDEVSVPPRWPWCGRVLTTIFAMVAVLACFYIVWRGFAAESARPVVPLFGAVTTLQWEGQQHRFLLVDYADLNALHPGELVIREKEPGPVVWKVVSRDASRLRLERRRQGQAQEETIPLPAGDAAPRFILLRPAS